MKSVMSMFCVVLVGMFLMPQAMAAPTADVAVASQPIKDKWALVVGISKFRDPSLNLRFPSNDARDFYNYLVTDGKFAKDHVKLLVDEQATRENILELLGDKWLPRAAMPGDLVVIYLSTHGSPSELDVGGVNYIVAHDTNKDSLYASGIAMQDLCRIIKARVHSDRAVIIMDACHSGATNPEEKGLVRSANVDADAISQGTGQMVICSSQPNETSWESKTANNSVFTKRLLEALRVKGSDTPMSDAFDYLKEKVQEDVLRERGKMQTPVLKSKWDGSDVRLSAAPIAPRPPLILEPKEPPADTKIAAAVREPAVKNALVTNSNPVTASAPSARAAEVQAKKTSFDSSDAAEKALRDHFVRMAYGTPEQAYSDFADNIKKVTPFARYSVNMRKQKYVPAVANMPPQAFKRVSNTDARAVILVNEKWITGQPILWRYTLVNKSGSWLIDGFKIISAAEWN